MSAIDFVGLIETNWNLKPLFGSSLSLLIFRQIFLPHLQLEFELVLWRNLADIMDFRFYSIRLSISLKSN